MNISILDSGPPPRVSVHSSKQSGLCLGFPIQTYSTLLWRDCKRFYRRSEPSLTKASGARGLPGVSISRKPSQYLPYGAPLWQAPLKHTRGWSLATASEAVHQPSQWYRKKTSRTGIIILLILYHSDLYSTDDCTVYNSLGEK